MAARPSDNDAVRPTCIEINATWRTSTVDGTMAAVCLFVRRWRFGIVVSASFNTSTIWLRPSLYRPISNDLLSLSVRLSVCQSPRFKGIVCKVHELIIRQETMAADPQEAIARARAIAAKLSGT